MEPRLRRLVADHLGVDGSALGDLVSLRDDLAADSLDLAELAVVLERDFGIAVSDHVVDGLRSYGDVVDATVRLVLENTSEQQSPRFWARLRPPEGASGGTVESTGTLTPYTAETLAWDARRAGAGARLEIVIAPGGSDGDLARASGRFAHLAVHGVRVKVRRHDRAIAVHADEMPPAATA